ARIHRLREGRMDLADVVFGTYASWSNLVVRLGLGIVFFAHGSQKVLGWFGGPGLRGTVAYMKQALGVPAPLAALATLTELLAGDRPRGQSPPGRIRRPGQPPQ